MSYDQQDLSLIPSTPIIFPAHTPPAHELSVAINQRLQEIHTLLGRVKKRDLPSRISAVLTSTGFMSVEDGGPDKDKPQQGHMHDVILSTELYRTPGHYYVSRDGELLQCVNPGAQKTRLRFTHVFIGSLDTYPRSTLYPMLEDLTYLATSLRQ